MKLRLLTFSAIAIGLALVPARAAERPTVYVQPNAPGMITINYEHAGDDGVEYFRIERDGAEIKTAYTPEGQLVDSDLQPSTQYTYRVCAVYPDEEACSPDIPVITGPPEQAPANMDPPINIKVEATESSITVSWGSIGEYSRILARIEGDNGYVNQVDLEPRAGRAYTFRNLKAGVRHRVSLKGCTKTLLGSSCGPWSEARYATTNSPEEELPPPEDLRLQVLGEPTEYNVTLGFEVRLARKHPDDRFIIYRNNRRIQVVAPADAAPGANITAGSFTDTPTNNFGRELDYHACFESVTPPARVCSNHVNVVLPDPGVVTNQIDPDLITKDDGIEEKRDTDTMVTPPAGVDTRPNSNARSTED